MAPRPPIAERKKETEQRRLISRHNTQSALFISPICGGDVKEAKYAKKHSAKMTRGGEREPSSLQ